MRAFATIRNCLVLALALLPFSVVAEAPPKSREEAIVRAQKRVDELKAMDDQRWQAAAEAEQAERQKPWHLMTEEERTEARKALMKRQRERAKAAGMRP